MASGYVADDLYVVTLPPEPNVSKELQAVNEMVSERCDFDVIVNFRGVEILTSPSLANMITLHSLVRGAGHQLVLYNMGLTTKSIFLATGLDALFYFVDDRAAAIEACRSGLAQHAENRRT